MIGRVGRAEALAAVALVVGARQEPVAALRRMAANDPALGVLTRVADLLADGHPLTAALVTCRLLRRADGDRLAAADPVVLAEELTRCAHQRAVPPFGEILAAWFPVWVVLVAALPSLAVSAVVALMTGRLYDGMWNALMMQSMLRGGGRLDDLLPLPAPWWFVQAGAVVLAAALAGGLWWTFRESLARRGLSIIAGGLDRAALFADLLRRLRSGGDHRRLLERWLWRSGDPWGVHEALSGCGGDATAAFMELGLIPRDADGRPAWDAALAEADRRRQRAALEVQPWLVALLFVAGILGFFSWGMGTDSPSFGLGLASSSWISFTLPDLGGQMMLILGDVLKKLLIIAVGVVVIADLLFVFGWLQRWLGDAVRDWPLVADRMARALERREDVDAVLRGLRFAVHRPMRRRLERALAEDQPHPGRRLVDAGVVPAAQGRAIAAASGADLPALLRTAAADPDDHGLRVTLGQAMPLLAMSMLVAGILWYLATGVFPKFATMSASAGQTGALSLVPALVWWALTITQTTIVGMVLVGIITAVGRRRGWWVAWDGWARLARGLVLRRQLAAGCHEEELARALRAIAPGLPPTLEGAARRGDLPGLLAVAGWQVRDAAGLDRAINARFIAQDRRRMRLALVARCTLPILIAVPVGLTSASTMLWISGIQGRMMDLSHENRTLPSGGGTPGMALIFWWTHRCEAQGQAVVDRVRESRLPLKPAPRVPPPVQR